MSKKRFGKVARHEKAHVTEETMTMDTLRKVPHPSKEGLAFQARVKGS